MINLRNEGDFPIVMQIAGALTTTGVTTNIAFQTSNTVGQACYDISTVIPFNAVVKAVWGQERVPGTSTGVNSDSWDLLYFPPASATVGGVSSTAPISFVNPANVFSTCMFNMATSTTSGPFYGQVPLVTLNTAATTLGGYGAIFTSATQFNPPQVARGGVFAIVVRTVGTVPGKDITVTVELARARNAAYATDPMQIGTYGADSDIY